MQFRDKLTLDIHRVTLNTSSEMMRKNEVGAILGVVAMGLLVGSLLVGQTKRTSALEEVRVVLGLDLKTLILSFAPEALLAGHLARQLPLLAI